MAGRNRFSGVRLTPEETLRIHGGKIDAVLQGSPLRKVMACISRETGMKVWMDRSLLSDPVFTRFKGLPLERGLQRIIGDNSYVMIFSGRRVRGEGEWIREIRVYPKGRRGENDFVRVEASVADGSGMIPASRAGDGPVMDVASRVRINREITRSARARMLAERRNKRRVGNTPGFHTIIGQARARIERARRLMSLKNGISARKEIFRHQMNLYHRRAALAKAAKQRAEAHQGMGLGGS